MKKVERERKWGEEKEAKGEGEGERESEAPPPQGAEGRRIIPELDEIYLHSPLRVHTILKIPPAYKSTGAPFDQTLACGR